MKVFTMSMVTNYTHRIRMEIVVDMIQFSLWSKLYAFSANLLLRIFSRQLHSIWQCFALAVE